jgi:hypothetical protein
VQSVVLTVRRGGPTGPLRSARTTALGAGDGRRALPLYVGVIAADDDVETPVWIEALGCGDPNGCSAAGAVVAQRAVVRFTRGQTEEVPLLLASACVGRDLRGRRALRGTSGAASRRRARRRRCGPSTSVGRDVAADVAADVVVATDVTAADAPDVRDAGSDAVTTPDVRDAGSDVVTTPDVTAMDVVDVPVLVDLGTPPVDRPTPVDGVLPPSDDGRIMCPSGQTLCVSTCRDLAVDRTNCGACDRACGTSESCTAGACVAPVTPRPIAPLSTAIVTSRRPLLRWALASGTDGAAVEICRDRACTVVVTSFLVSGDRGAPTVELPAGVLFWRLRGRTSGVTDARYSPTWQFTVGARSAPVNASSGTVPDFNGDGFADVVVGTIFVNRVYVYLGSPGGLAGAPAATLTGPDGALDTFGTFGGSVASAGDVNGDGYADLVVGASGVMSNTGRAYVYLGSAGGLAVTPATTLAGRDGELSQFGASVASAGDVNGDGYADLVIGAPNVMSNAGRTYVYLGNANGSAATPATVLIAPDGSLSRFGDSVGSAGDVNGDGYADIAVGAAGITNRERAYVYLGSMSGPSVTSPTTLTTPDGFGVSFGCSVANAGDVDGDGYTDLVVGARSVMTGTGRAYVYRGSASGLVTTPATTLTGLESRGAFSSSVATAGDVNGDGYADLGVGAPSAMSDTGRAYLYLGGSGGLRTTPATTLTAPDGANSEFGRSLAGAGDVNGDGYADFVVGAPGVMTATGRAYLYPGSSSALATTAATTLSGPHQCECPLRLVGVVTVAPRRRGRRLSASRALLSGRARHQWRERCSRRPTAAARCLRA